MGPNRKCFLNDCATLPTLLGSETRVDSYHPMSSILSFGREDIKKRAPTGIVNALGKMMVFHHIRDLKVFNHNPLIAFSIGLCHVKEEVPSLTANFEMSLCDVASSDASSLAALLATAKLTLFPSQRFLRRAIETRIVNGVTLAIGQEGFQTDIDSDGRMLTRSMLSLRGHFTHNEGIPMSISPQNEMSGFRCSLKRSVQLDLERPSKFSRDHEALLVFMHIAIFPILSQLDRVPLVSRLEARKTDFHRQFSIGKKAFEGLRNTISKHLNGCGWYVFPTAPSEGRRQIVLARKGLCDLVLPLDGLKHLVIELARLDQALHQQVMLFFCRIESILKRFYGSTVID